MFFDFDGVLTSERSKSMFAFKLFTAATTASLLKELVRVLAKEPVDEDTGVLTGRTEAIEVLSPGLITVLVELRIELE